MTIFLPFLSDLSCRVGGNGSGLKRKNPDDLKVGAGDHHDEDSVISRKIEDFDSENERLKKKKVRTTFTGRQIFELEKMFETKKYLSSSERTELAKMLNVTEQQVLHSSSSCGKILFLKLGMILCTHSGLCIIRQHKLFLLIFEALKFKLQNLIPA